MQHKPRRYQGVLSHIEMLCLSNAELEQRYAEGWVPPIGGGDGENTFITPQLIARVGLATLYNNLVLAGLVWRDFDQDFTGKQGDTITIRKPAVFHADKFDRSTGIKLQDVEEDGVAVKLDTIADVSFAVTSEELTLDIDDFAARLLTPAMMAIVAQVDLDLANALVAAATGPGGGGTATMDSKASDAMVTAREKLTRNKLPVSERSGVLSPEATSVALSDDLFVQAQQAGTTDALRNANVGRAFGIDTYESGQFGYGSGDAGAADGVAFHRTAVTLASRTLQAPNGVATEQVAIEQFRGLGLRVVYQYDITHKQDVVSVDFLYGLVATRPEGAVAIDMGQGS